MIIAIELPKMLSIDLTKHASLIIQKRIFDKRADIGAFIYIPRKIVIGEDGSIYDHKRYKLLSLTTNVIQGMNLNAKVTEYIALLEQSIKISGTDIHSIASIYRCKNIYEMNLMLEFIMKYMRTVRSMQINDVGYAIAVISGELSAIKNAHSKDNSMLRRFYNGPIGQWLIRTNEYQCDNPYVTHMKKDFSKWHNDIKITMYKTKKPLTLVIGIQLTPPMIPPIDYRDRTYRHLLPAGLFASSKK
jgi:hypothetical protein